ncbi:MAG: hypothetical protein M5U10_14615 [Candidatus Methanoperedens sp.]|nr:hypothetical protein [Candidatus Methanoperedens sp.]
MKIQPEERLAATFELNPTPNLVTGCCEAGGKGYQAAIIIKKKKRNGSEGYKPRNFADLGS